MNPSTQADVPPPMRRSNSERNACSSAARRQMAATERRRRFVVQKSTEELHSAEPNGIHFYGAHGKLRKDLDYNYHSHYRKERQLLHDAIIEDSFLADEDISVNQTALPTTSLWLILAVGVHGVGKHRAVQDLILTNRLRLLSLVCIDTDDLRTYLPEYSTFLKDCPDILDDLTRKEAGYISETLTIATLQMGRNAILFCSPKDCDWYVNAFLPKLRQQYPGLKIGLLHVTAEIGREIGMPSAVQSKIVDTVDCSISRSFDWLKPVVDYSCTIRSDGGTLQLVDGRDWASFTDVFDQRSRPSCLASEKCRLDEVERGKQSFTADLRRRSTLMQRFSAFQSSEDNHKSNDRKFYGPFADTRATLDYSYHKNYTCDRQLFQDAIINEFLNDAVLKDENGEVCTTPTMPWIVFTAGAFGAGKGYTLKKLVQKGRFPLTAFVRVDPDAIRRYLPEYHLYVQQNPEQAGELTNKEAGFIAEILTLAGLQSQKNVIVDGSLRRVNWYRDYFSRLRTDFPSLRIAIIHVTAPRETIFKRAAERAIHTGRIVPRDLLVESLEQVPRSVRQLATQVDYHVELRNVTAAPDIELVTPGETWQSFTAQWIQTCAWVPKSRDRLLEKSKRIEQQLANGSET